MRINSLLLNRKLLYLGLLVGASIIVIQSCKHTVGDCKGGESKTSSAGDNESHNMGENCLKCHNGKDEAPCFTLGGTVYDSAIVAPKTGGILKLYTGPNGTGDLVKTIEVDGRGNFYTSKTINFIGGLYPSITSKSGNTKYMGSPIQIGTCNSCHGATTSKITVN